jgi:hypothetical protein
MSRLDKFRVVRSHSKVVDVDVDPPARKTRDKADDFAQVPLKWAAKVAKAMNSPQRHASRSLGLPGLEDQKPDLCPVE